MSVTPDTSAVLAKRGLQDTKVKEQISGEKFSGDEKKDQERGQIGSECSGLESPICGLSHKNISVT